MNGDTEERFKDVFSTLEQLANSQRHLLTAQVLMNGRMERTEMAIQKLAEENLKIAEKMDSLADQQKHTDANLAALTDIVRRWYERHGNGQQPS
jgi:hypothetical protein